MFSMRPSDLGIRTDDDHDMARLNNLEETMSPRTEARIDLKAKASTSKQKSTENIWLFRMQATFTRTLGSSAFSSLHSWQLKDQLRLSTLDSLVSFVTHAGN